MIALPRADGRRRSWRQAPACRLNRPDRRRVRGCHPKGRSEAQEARSALTDPHPSSTRDAAQNAKSLGQQPRVTFPLNQNTPSHSTSTTTSSATCCSIATPASSRSALPAACTITIRGSCTSVRGITILTPHAGCPRILFALQGVTRIFTDTCSAIQSIVWIPSVSTAPATARITNRDVWSRAGSTIAIRHSGGAMPSHNLPILTQREMTTTRGGSDARGNACKIAIATKTRTKTPAPCSQTIERDLGIHGARRSTVIRSATGGAPIQGLQATRLNRGGECAGSPVSPFTSCRRRLPYFWPSRPLLPWHHGTGATQISRTGTS